MKSDEQLQKDVQDAIKWEPSMHTAEIGVTAKKGIITLSGIVSSYAKKLTAEHAAKNVHGVKAVAEEIIIDYGTAFKKNDRDLTNEVVDEWTFNWGVPKDKIKVTVENGWVKLEGEVDWKFQEEASKNAVKNLFGVKGVTSLIKIASNSTTQIEKKDVENALFRNWSINSKEVKVEVENNSIKLTGLVHSLYQKDEAERLAWNAPGVNSVENELAIFQ